MLLIHAVSLYLFLILKGYNKDTNTFELATCSNQDPLEPLTGEYIYSSDNIPSCELA